jgi:hypothetical protein
MRIAMYTGLVALMSYVAGCDPRTAVRTVIRGGSGDEITEQCIDASLNDTRDWRLDRGSWGGLAVFSSQTHRPSFNLKLSREDNRSVVILEVAIDNGAPNLSRLLRETEAAERTVASLIAGRCTKRASISCWDFKRKAEVPQCFP